MGSGMSHAKANTKSLSLFFFITAIILVAFNLRPAITSVGPLVGIIGEDLGLANWSLGLLTSLPLIAFAAVSPIVPNLANRLTTERTMLLGLVILLTGICIRSISMVFLLFIGTILVGVGIAVCNVLLPVIVKNQFPDKIGLMTSVYSTSMGLVASLASGLSVPLASGGNLGWQKTLIIWGIPAALAIIIWIYVVKQRKGNGQALDKVRSSDHRIWRSSLAWQIALYFGLQSFLFYVTIAWLPAILNGKGMSMESSGWLLSLTQFIGLPLSFIIPVLATRFRSQRLIAFLLGVCSVVGFGGLLLDSSYPIMIISIVLMGIGLGGTFPLGLTFIAIRARNGSQAAELSGMVQSIGYILAAIGPMLFGSLYDFTQMWTAPIISLVIVSALLIIFGIYSGRDKYVY